MSLKIEKETAKRLYSDAPEWFKQDLINEFGEKTFEKKDYENLETFDDCCKVCGTTEEEFNSKFLNIGLSPDALALERLGIINKAINGPEWKPDYSNPDQQKWFPVFKASSPGSGFSFTGSGYLFVSAVADVGSRLCFESEEKSLFSGTRFTKFWEALITNKEV